MINGPFFRWTLTFSGPGSDRWSCWLRPVFHDFDCHLTGAHGKADQFLDRQPVVREGFQGENIEIIRLIAVIAELSRLMPVGADAFESVENGLTQGPDVRSSDLSYMIPAMGASRSISVLVCGRS